MVDLSKHLVRAKQSLERRQYDYVIEQMEQCLDLDPGNMEVHRMLLDAARRRAKETGGKGGLGSMFGGLGSALSKDPLKVFAGVAKRLGKNPEPKLLAEMGDAALKLAQTIKPVNDVAVFYYEEFLATGLFNQNVLWSLAHVFFERFGQSKDATVLDRAIKLLRDIERGNPQHPEASRTIKNWEALRSMSVRSGAAGGAGGGGGGDYRSQLASDSGAKRAEAMNRTIRTVEDAKEVLGYVDQDLTKAADDKSLWLKKGDLHKRIGQVVEAKAAFLKAQGIDPHDFTVTMRLGDLLMEEARAKVQALTAAGQDAGPAKAELAQIEIAEFRKRVERQPMETSHRYNLAQRLIQTGDIDGAAAEFQKTVGDPKLKQKSHRFLGFCFTKKNLLDLACQQYTSYLSLVLDDQADEAKSVRYERARVLEDQGKREDAITDYQRIVNIDLNFKDAATRLNKLRSGN